MEVQKKVGIVTLHGYFNYGNRLQNYALQEVIKELGFQVDTIVIPRKSGHPHHKKETRIERVRRLIRLSPGEILKRSQDKILRCMDKHIAKHRYRHVIQKRTEVFRQFSENFLNERFVDHSKETLENIGLDYDFFISGSDQVWNPHFIRNAEDAFFLTFADSKKRLSYAASFGISDLSEEYKRKIKPWLLEMKSISVREASGAEIVKDLAGRDAVVSLDPTLLLSREKWLSIVKEAPKPHDKFILTYFLGKKPEEGEKIRACQIICVTCPTTGASFHRT